MLWRRAVGESGGRTLTVGAARGPTGVKTFAKDQISATLQQCILSRG